MMPEAAETVQRAAAGPVGSPALGRGQAAGSDGIELPGDVIANAPQVANVGLADEGIGASLMPPIKEVDVPGAG